MAVPEFIRKVPRPVNTIVGDNGKDGPNRYPVRERISVKYVSGGNPQPKNGKVIGHIVDGVYVPLGEPSIKAEPDMLSYGASAFVRSVSRDLFSELLSVYTPKDAYKGEGDFEVKVTMLNINYGKNQNIMEACEPLKEYAWLVDAVRAHQKEKMDLDAAVDASLNDMSKEYVIRKFLLENRAEVKNMFLTEYNEEKVLEKERQEGRWEGRQEGRQEGRDERSIEVAIDLIAEGKMTAAFIARISRLSEETVRKLAKEKGVLLV